MQDVVMGFRVLGLAFQEDLALGLASQEGFLALDRNGFLEPV
jgi:hypothetical protein